MADALRPAIMVAIHTPPLALRREAAAAMLSISPSEFDNWVKRGIMPRSKKVGRIALWDTKKIVAAYQTLMDDIEMEADEWEQVSL